MVVLERGVDIGGDDEAINNFMPLSEAVAVGTLSVVASEVDQVSRL